MVEIEKKYSYQTDTENGIDVFGKIKLTKHTRLINIAPPRKNTDVIQIITIKRNFTRIQGLNKLITQWNPPNRFRTRLTTQRKFT